MRLPKFGAAVALIGLLNACAAAPDLIGIGTGGAAGALTANPYVAIAVGAGVRAVVKAGLDEAKKTRQDTRQQALADVAGGLAVGETARWQAEHVLNIGNVAGQVEVLREIATPLATCKEVALQVDGEPNLFITSLCGYDDGWHWATAEPATTRWGYLQ